MRCLKTLESSLFMKEAEAYGPDISKIDHKREALGFSCPLFITLPNLKEIWISHNTRSIFLATFQSISFQNICTPYFLTPTRQKHFQPVLPPQIDSAFRFPNSRCWKRKEKRKKNLHGRWKIHSVKECTQGSVPASTSHLFLLSSSRGLRNLNWCLYLCFSGSGEHLCVWMRANAAPHCKSFHIPSHGANSQSLSQRRDVLWSWEILFCCVILAWNTTFGNWNHEPFGECFTIQTSF